MESDGIQRRHPEMTVSRALLRHQQSGLYTIGEPILLACFIEIRVVYTYSLLTALLSNHHHISKPFGVLYFFDETCLREVVYFCLNNPMAVRVETSHFLSHGLSRVDDIQLVGG